jgi:prepilin peptidase CpaA
VSPAEIVVAAAVGIAAVWDLRTRRIPNWLTIPAALAGLAVNAWTGGRDGLQSAALGLGLALLIGLPLFALHALGGGDVKLMAAIGAGTGSGVFLKIFVVNAVLGGIAAAVLIFGKRRLRRTLGNIGWIVADLARLRAPHRRSPELDVESEGALRLARAPILAVATLLVIAAGAT